MRHRGMIMLIWLIALILVVYTAFQFGKLPDTKWSAHNLAGAVLLAFGTMLIGGAFLHIGAGGIGEVVPRAAKLAVTGPYAFMRHPIYVGLTFLLLGLAVRLQSPVGMAAVVLLFVPASILRGREEDRALQERFGQEWLDYAARVGFWLPRVRRGESGPKRA